VLSAEGLEDERSSSPITDRLGEEIDLKSLPRGMRKKDQLLRRALLLKAGGGSSSSRKRTVALKDALDQIQLSVSDLGAVDADLRKESSSSSGSSGGGGVPAVIEEEDEEDLQQALRIGDLEVVKAQGLKHGLTEALPTDGTAPRYAMHDSLSRNLCRVVVLLVVVVVVPNRVVVVVVIIIVVMVIVVVPSAQFLNTPNHPVSPVPSFSMVVWYSKVWYHLMYVKEERQPNSSILSRAVYHVVGP